MMMLVSLDNQIIHNTMDKKLNNTTVPWVNLIEEADDSDNLRAAR